MHRGFNLFSWVQTIDDGASFILSSTIWTAQMKSSGRISKCIKFPIFWEHFVLDSNKIDGSWSNQLPYQQKRSFLMNKSKACIWKVDQRMIPMNLPTWGTLVYQLMDMLIDQKQLSKRRIDQILRERERERERERRGRDLLHGTLVLCIEMIWLHWTLGSYFIFWLGICWN